MKVKKKTNFNLVFKSLRSAFKIYFYYWILALIFLVLAAIATLIVPLAFKDLIDSGLSASNINNKFLNLFILSIVLAFLVSARFYLMSWIGERVVTDIRKSIFKHLINQPPIYYESVLTGEVLSRLTTDTTLIQTLIGSSISIALRSVILFLGGITLMLYTNLELASLMIFLLILVIFPVVSAGKKVRKMSKFSQDKVADTSAMAGEVLNAVKTVQSFVRENHEMTRFNLLAEKAFEVAKKRVLSRAFLTIIAICLSFSGVVFTLWVGANQVLNNDLTIGDLMQFVFYAVFVAVSLAALSEVWGDLQRAAGATERIIELMGSSPLISETIENSIVTKEKFSNKKYFKKFKNINIEFKDVTFSYPSKPNLPTIKKLNFKLNNGSCNALVGPSGAGKSTIFSLLLGFYNSFSGEIKISGNSINSYNLDFYRNSIGLVSQDPVIFSTDAMENIRYGRLDAQDQEVIEAARVANAHDFIMKLPNGYKSFLGDRGLRLSTGQRQRIAIARAILRNPSLLLLDEATSSLDSQSEREVQVALEKLLPGRTSLIIAHRLSTVQKVDQILVINNGHVEEKGTHEKLIKNNGLYKKLASYQFKLK